MNAGRLKLLRHRVFYPGAVETATGTGSAVISGRNVWNLTAIVARRCSRSGACTMQPMHDNM
jgi:hypothetical protein